MSKVDSKYRCDDRELLMGVYKLLIFNRILPFIPRWVHPNTLTILGSICVVLAAFVAAFAVNGGSTLLYLVSAGLLFGYLILDNVDGAHARRTGQTSPTGEFLDHGMDAIASGALLLTGLMVVRLEPMVFTGMLIVGAFAFVVCMWEQNQTGTLVIPAVSASEGVTLISGVCILQYVFAEPAWLFYEAGVLKTATGLILFVAGGYVAALVPPLLRGRKAGGRLDELAPVLLLLSCCGLYTLIAGANPVLTGAMVTLIGADVASRYILVRHERVRSNPLLPAHWLVLLPLMPALFAKDLWHADGWVLLSLGLALTYYLRTLAWGVAAFRHASEELRPAG